MMLPQEEQKTCHIAYVEDLEPPLSNKVKLIFIPTHPIATHQSPGKPDRAGNHKHMEDLVQKTANTMAIRSYATPIAAIIKSPIGWEEQTCGRVAVQDGRDHP